MAEGPRPGRRELLVGGAAAAVFASGVVSALRKAPGDATAGAAPDVPTRRGRDRRGTTSTSAPAESSSTSTTAGDGRAAGGGTAGPGSTIAEPSRPLPGEPRRALTPEERRLHLVQRTTFGPTADLLEEVERRGEVGFVDWQLAAHRIDDGHMGRSLGGLPSVGWSAARIAQDESGVLGRPPGTAAREARLATVVRAVASNRQLHEVMAGFWSDHFNVGILSPTLRIRTPEHDRDLRRHALGRFADLLAVSSRSPAMLDFLDGAQNVAAHPNENFARELLELHTVGVGNYTERDVLEAARVFTGWTIGDSHGFRFDARTHDAGPARVLGWSTGGRAGGAGLHDGEALLAYLARHPATARHLATKLARKFVADDPPGGLVDRLAQVYLTNDTAIAPVLRALLTSAEFFEHAGEKLRRPLDFTAYALRVTGARMDPREPELGKRLDHFLRQMGQMVFDWPAPDGYPDTADAWASPGDIAGRWSLAMVIAEGAMPGLTVDLDRITGRVEGSTVGEVVVRILGRVVPGPVTAAAHDALVAMAGQSASEPFPAKGRDRLRRELVAAALCTAEAQFR